MPADDARLLSLAVAISDGAEVDWDEAVQSAADENQRDLLHQLRLLADIGKVHRSDHPSADPETATSTEPALGRTIRHYRLVSKLGEGAMGIVWKAEDSVLGRSVAIKFLSDTHARSPEQLARFEREARVLAALNHPAIAAIYGLEKSDGVCFLVLEFVPGQTLAERCASGSLTLKESLDICRQIAAGLEVAHEQGIIHRDLKPANIKITPDGKVKVLDFGLAKALEGSPTASGSTETRPGVVLGTPAYSSPEQACGQPVDRRTDIWAFGCILYELLTGQRAFVRDTVSATVGAVLNEEPDWDAVPAKTPENLRTLLRRCLTKDANRRLRDIGDARLELEETLDPASSVGGASPIIHAPLRWRNVVLGCILGISVGAAASWVALTGFRDPQAPPRTPIRFSVRLPPEMALSLTTGSGLVFSPDDKALVFAALGEDGTSRIYYRPMDALEPRPIPGTEGGRMPFFSPDGEWVGFVTTSRLLKKVRTVGGTPVELCPALDRGGSWSSDGYIYFTPSLRSGIARIPENGGEAVVVTTLDVSRGEVTHRYPHVLPRGKHLFFNIGLASIESYDDAPVAVQSLETGERRIILEGGTNARYLESGHLVYAREGRLLTVPFDLEGLELSGPAVLILEGIATDPNTGYAEFAVSRTGSVAFLTGNSDNHNRSLLSVDLDGNMVKLTDEMRPYGIPRLSPNGDRIAITLNRFWDDVWIFDMERRTLSRLTSDTGNDIRPIWHPDGARVTYSSDRTGLRSLFNSHSDGSGPSELLYVGAHDQFLAPSSWSPDGRFMVFTELDPETSADIWLLPTTGDRERFPFLRTDANEGEAVFSPDGRWIAYESNVSSRNEVYVQRFPSSGARHQISVSGGSNAAWSPDGRTLYYLWENAIHAVPVELASDFKAGTPRVVLRGPTDLGGSIWGYDVRPDGQGFIVVLKEPPSEPPTINVVIDAVGVIGL